MTAAILKTQDEAQIQQLIADQSKAICRKDLGSIMANYAPDVVLYDVKPPFQLKGATALRSMWEACLPCMPTAIDTERQDLKIAISGDLALAHWIFRFTGLQPEHPASQMWFRVTSACQRQQGEWKIIHEHLSVPFDPQTMQAVFIPNA